MSSGLTPDNLTTEEAYHHLTRQQGQGAQRNPRHQVPKTSQGQKLSKNRGRDVWQNAYCWQLLGSFSQVFADSQSSKFAVSVPNRVFHLLDPVDNRMKHLVCDSAFGFLPAFGLLPKLHYLDNILWFITYQHTLCIIGYSKYVNIWEIVFPLYSAQHLPLF